MKKASQAYLSETQSSAPASLEQFLPLVRRIAHKMSSRLPASVEVGDLIQAGCLGLAQAWGRFSETGGASFETFAGTRIRGAMLDWLRAEDQLPKQTRQDARKVESAIGQLRSALGREPREEEVADAVGLALDDYQSLVAQVDGAHLIHLEDLASDGHEPWSSSDSSGDPLAQLMESESAKALASFIDSLPEREQLVLSLHHEEEMTFKEIGLVLDISEARVSQLHSHALTRIKSLLAAHLRD